MDTNTLGIGAAIGAFFIWYWNDQKKVMKRRRIQPARVNMPDLHADSFSEEVSPVLYDAHSGNLLGPHVIEPIDENAAFFVPADMGGSGVKEETISLREYSTGRTPQHRELLTKGKMAMSAIPWAQARSHVAAEAFLKKEGLIPSNVDTEVNKHYFQLWPNPFQHPYQ
jgi:hypothetical protein